MLRMCWRMDGLGRGVSEYTETGWVKRREEGKRGEGRVYDL